MVVIVPDIASLMFNSCIFFLEEKHRYAEIAMRSDADLVIDIQKRPPHRLTLKKKLEFSDHVTSVCHHKGFTYIATKKKIARVHPDWSADHSFITCPNEINSVRACDNALVALMRQPQTLRVYDLSGNLVRLWLHAFGNAGFGSKLTIVGDQLCVMEMLSPLLSVYSLDGKLVNTIDFSQVLGDTCPSSFVTLTQCGGENLVIIADRGMIMTFNHRTNQLVKTSKHSFQDTAIASLVDGDIVLLAGSSWYEGTNMIIVRMLNISTGK